MCCSASTGLPIIWIPACKRDGPISDRPSGDTQTGSPTRASPSTDRSTASRANEGGNQLHGGPVGFDRVVWRTELLDDAPGVRLRHISPHGDQGFPGRMEAQAEFLLGAPGELIIRYTATTDRTTHVSMASHPYFNLAGRGSRSIAQHRLTVAADAILPIDAAAIPLRESPMPVAGTAFDLHEGQILGAIFQTDHPQLRTGDGFNHCFLLDPNASLAARLEHPESGRCLELVTTAPGLQIYSANDFDGSLTDGEGRLFVRRQAIALEAAALPRQPEPARLPIDTAPSGRNLSQRNADAFFNPLGGPRGAVRSISRRM